MSTTLPRVLLVDDEPHVVDGLRRILRHDFDAQSATSPVEGLERLRQDAPYAVVMSDFQMPQMNGAEFLAAVRQVSPDTARILLTGQADLLGAAAVVNEGGIMRMLLKPATREDVVAALRAGVEAHRLVTAERELLDNTLRGSIRALTEVLSLANPAAFEGSKRLHGLITALADATGTELPWHVDVAVMLSNLGAIAVPPEVLERAQRGGSLSEQERGMIDGLPAVADQILAGIPRIEAVRTIIRGDASTDPEDPPTSFGLHALKLARAFDALVTRDIDPATALGRLRGEPDTYAPALLDALADLLADQAERRPQHVRVDELCSGMVLVDDIVTRNGVRLVAKGHELTTTTLTRVRNYALIDPGVVEPIQVFVAG